MSIRTSYKLFLSGIAMALLATACSKGKTTEKLRDTERETLTLAMRVNVPAQEPPAATRQMRPEDENRLRTLHLLVFRTDGDGERYAYTARVVDRKESTDGQGIVTLTVNLLRGKAGEKFRLVLLANLDDFTPPAIGTSRDEALREFLVDLPGKWDATAGSGTIPMWGESAALELRDASAQPVDFHTGRSPIRLLRALARVDVGAAFDSAPDSETVNGLADFALTSVAVYRSALRARVVPELSDLEEGIAVRPTLPDGTDLLRPAEEPLIYEMETAADVCLREIYLPEAPAATSADDGVCLVIGGYYGIGNTTEQTFYRVDFLTPKSAAGSQQYLPILRNHRYRINILKVSGPGFGTREEALQTRPTNLETSVNVWDETAVGDVVYDGQYMLGVSHRALTYYREASSQVLTVRTDHPDGWRIQVAEGQEWLSCSPASDAPGRDTEVNCTVAANDTDNERRGAITVTAGHMNWRIEVVQHPYSSLSLALTDVSGKEISQMEFAARNVEAQQFRLTWSPATATVEVHRAGDPFAGEPTADIVGGNGTADFTIDPAELVPDPADPLRTRSETITFVVKGEDGSSVARTLTLSQKEYDALPETAEGISLLDDSGVYLLDGKNTSFRIRANTPYRLRMVENAVDETAGGTPGPVIQESIDRRYNGKISGESIAFTPYDDLTNPTRYIGHATFEITSTASPERFAPKRFRILLASGIPQQEANSYLLNPNGKTGILIPVGRANTYSQQEGMGSVLGEETPFGVRTVWNEQPGTGEGSNIRLVKAVGRGKTGYILVLPGTMSGNAVVAATNSNGKILWSWHLWVTTYSPDPGQQWMDRHLGAMANSQEAGNASFGLLYQWGRKDPFPSTSTALYYGDAATEQPFPSDYNKSTTQYTLQQSVENPHVRVQNLSNWLAGANNGSAHWYDLWGGEIVSKDGISASPTRKSVFDPCPPGWKVPSYGDEGWGTQTISSSPSHNNYGDYLTGKGGWYPITGQLLSNSNAFGHTDEGYCWTSSVRPTLAYAYYLVIRRGSTHLVNNAYYYRTTGMSVRCVRDK